VAALEEDKPLERRLQATGFRFQEDHLLPETCGLSSSSLVQNRHSIVAESFQPIAESFLGGNSRHELRK